MPTGTVPQQLATNSASTQHISTMPDVILPISEAVDSLVASSVRLELSEATSQSKDWEVCVPHADLQWWFCASQICRSALDRPFSPHLSQRSHTWTLQCSPDLKRAAPQTPPSQPSPRRAPPTACATPPHTARCSRHPAKPPHPLGYTHPLASRNGRKCAMLPWMRRCGAAKEAIIAVCARCVGTKFSRALGLSFVTLGDRNDGWAGVF